MRQMGLDRRRTHFDGMGILRIPWRDVAEDHLFRAAIAVVIVIFAFALAQQIAVLEMGLDGRRAYFDGVGVFRITRRDVAESTMPAPVLYGVRS